MTPGRPPPQQLIVERDGYRWTNPTDGTCRGCAIAPLFGKRCPVHPEDGP